MTDEQIKEIVHDGLAEHRRMAAYLNPPWNNKPRPEYPSDGVLERALKEFAQEIDLD